MRPYKNYIRKFRDACHIIYPLLGALWYGMPSRKLTVIGITGTDGKSSSVYMTARILWEAGYRVGYFSSIGYGDGVREYVNSLKMTMPGRVFLQQFLYQLVQNECTHCVLEVTSEGVKQYRHRFINFDAVGITNITPEHIESHGSFENYKRSKFALIAALRRSSKKIKTLVLNTDDKELRMLANNPRVLTCGFNGVGADIVGTIVRNDMTASTVSLLAGTHKVVIQSSLGGPFIIKNILFAATMSTAMGVSLAVIKSTIENITVIPGRFEIVSQHPLVIVDYAHTVAALEELLSFVRQRCKGAIIHVFGAAGGGRDTWKRPQIARLSEKYTDVSILTEENPFDEDPRHIMDDILAGFSSAHRVIIESRREDAVQKAFSLATKDDTVLLTAKGSETVIAGPRGSRRSYNEREYVTCLISNMR